MKHLFLLMFLAACSGSVQAQCLSGNCEQGKGKYDFGWCVYEGDFKGGKPDGEGVMKYDDYTYAGHFSNGIENGQGTVTYKDGRKETVTYKAGKKLESPAKVAANDWKPLEGKDPGCISGDCNNGFGTYQFPSGNKYVGNFKASEREGQGIFYFNNGEQFAGEFHNNGFSNGTYTFASGASYTGTYDASGKELNGTVNAGSRHISISNGKAIIPKQEYYGYENTEATRQAAQARGSNKPKVAPIQWGSSQSDYDKQQDDIHKMLDHMDKMNDRMDRPYYTR